MLLLYLFAAGFVGGGINTLAGGGSFITFPALIAAGVNPIAANATNTFAAFAGYLSGAFGLRAKLASVRQELLAIIILSFLGAALGAYMLLLTPLATFNKLIAWLMLAATLLFIFGDKLNQKLQQNKLTTNSKTNKIFLAIFLLLIAAYGGFFNAGLGIIILSFLSLAAYQDINLMNAIKLLISAVVALVAIIIFIKNDLIVWREGLVLLSGNLAGGYAAARASQHIKAVYIKILAIIISISMCVYFFYKYYV